MSMTDEERGEFLRRCGKLIIPDQIVRSEPDIMMQVMGNLLVVRCEFMVMYNHFEYHAYSPKFRVLQEGEMTPEYLVSIETDDEGELTSIDFHERA